MNPTAPKIWTFRRFLLMAYQQNPKLLENAEARIKQLFDKPVLESNLSVLKNNPKEKQ